MGLVHFATTIFWYSLFPAWHCKKCNALLLANAKDLPIDPQEKSYPGKACPSCKSTDIIPDTDVMDTWNTSSITPYLNANLFSPSQDPFVNQKSFIPMGMRPQAHDIIRTWAFYTIIKAWMHNKTIPWHEIVISGHVLSEGKEKISKSKENNPLAPENLLQNYAADAIRYWTASGSLGHDISFSGTTTEKWSAPYYQIVECFSFYRTTHYQLQRITTTNTSWHSERVDP